MSTPILKKLEADPDDVVDMQGYTPSLEGSSLDIWAHFSANTPYWWTTSDLLTVERYCYLLSVDRFLRRTMNRAEDAADLVRYNAAWASMKSLSLELKNIEYALGVSPQGRAALKLSHPASQGKREEPDVVPPPEDPDDL